MILAFFLLIYINFIIAFVSRGIGKKELRKQHKVSVVTFAPVGIKDSIATIAVQQVSGEEGFPKRLSGKGGGVDLESESL